tara:strand:- start:2248 stop:4092 length:1845 start_codon:yes stop_codon:yes gene_type:complete
MNFFISHFFSDAGQIIALFSIALMWLGFSLIGSCASGSNRLPEIDHLIGWSVVSALFTILGVFTSLPFSILLTFICAMTLVCAFIVWRGKKQFAPYGWWRIILLGFPILLLAAAMRGSQWDDFGHWLLIPLYLVETDAFPSLENPYTKAGLSAYPYAWHFITLIASRIGGQLLESAGPLFNVLLSFGFGALVVRLMLIGSNYQKKLRITWGLASLAIAATMLLNPTFVQKIVLTAYAETSTAVATGTAVILAWFILEALINREKRDARRLALALGMILALLVNLKQATLILAILVVTGMAITGLRQRSIRKSDLISLFPIIVVPAVIIYLTWRYHVNTELVGQELSIRSYDEWLLNYIPDIISKMLSVLTKKGYYLILSVVMVLCGIYGFFRAEKPLHRFAAIATMVFLGYNSFLLFAYVASFGKYDALRAASFWRYNMHLGMMVVAFSAYGLGVLWLQHSSKRFRLRRWAPVSIILVSIAPFVFAEKLRFDKAPWVVYFRSVGAEVATIVQPEDKVFVADPRGSGESAVIASFELGLHPGYSGYVSAFFPEKLESLRSGIAQENVNLVLLHSTHNGYADIFGTNIPANKSMLLRRGLDDSWRIIKRWDHPTYN